MVGDVLRGFQRALVLQIGVVPLKVEICTLRTNTPNAFNSLWRYPKRPQLSFCTSFKSSARTYTEAMKFRIVLEFDPQSSSFSAVCPELPGCASAGETEEEALNNIEEAIKLYLEPAEILLSGKAKPVEVTIG